MFLISDNHDKIKRVILAISPGLNTLVMSVAATLPESLFFDLVSAEEVEAVHELEVQGKPTSVFPSVSDTTTHFQVFHPKKLLPLRNYGTFIFFTVHDVHRDTPSAFVRKMPRTSSLVPSSLRQAASVIS
jgi:hypothetical protein